MAGDYLSTFPAGGLYVMQGRLSPPEAGRFQCFPRERWRGEIDAAAHVPLRGIEWIYDAHGQGANPLESAAGRRDLAQRLVAGGIRVVSICADYFMDRPLVGVADAEHAGRVDTLTWLIAIAGEIGIGRIVLPFVDASRIRGDAARAQALSALRSALAQTDGSPVELHLETDLAPKDFAALLAEIDHPRVRVNYDAGNSASLGFPPAEEFAAYGSRVGSVHVKDRVLGGGTVPLGRGDTDFVSLRNALQRCGYCGDFVLQVARGEPGDEVRWLREQAALVTAWLRGEATIG